MYIFLNKMYEHFTILPSWYIIVFNRIHSLLLQIEIVISNVLLRHIKNGYTGVKPTKK